MFDREDLQRELERVKSVLLLLHNDLGNPEGSMIESVMQDVVEVAVERLDNALAYIQ